MVFRAPSSWTVLCWVAIALAAVVIVAPMIATATLPAAPASASQPRITVRGNQLYAGSRRWRAWGMNWGR